MTNDFEVNNPFSSGYRATFGGVSLSPNKFFIFDRTFENVDMSFNMDVILETPLYAFVGDSRSIRARVIALLRPEKLEMQSPNDTWVISLVDGNKNNQKDNKLFHLCITNKYSLTVPDRIRASSYWKLANSGAMNRTLHTIVSNPSHSVHSQYWHFDTTSAQLEAYYNSDGSKLRISGILIPAFSKVTNIHAFHFILVMGYRPGKDSKIVLIPQGEAILTDHTLFEV